MEVNHVFTIQAPGDLKFPGNRSMNRSMDCRRREPRFEIDQPVTVTNLEQPGIPQLGRLANFSAKGTRMILAHELTPGTMVKVEWGGTVLLGEIIYCAPHGSEFAVGLELEDVLYEKHMFASMSESWAALLQARR